MSAGQAGKGVHAEWPFTARRVHPLHASFPLPHLCLPGPLPPCLHLIFELDVHALVKDPDLTGCMRAHARQGGSEHGWGWGRKAER